MIVGYIYKITNKVNGKVYVGQTLDYERRIRQHFNKKQCKRTHMLKNAIDKYGKENFEHHIITDILCNTKEEFKEIADKLEIMYVSLYQSDVKGKGYNMTKGGNSAVVNDEAKNKIANWTIENNKKSRWVTNGSDNHFVRPDEYNNYIKNGYYPGRSKVYFITDGKINKRVKAEELEHYLSNGFVQGRTLS